MNVHTFQRYRFFVCLFYLALAFLDQLYPYLTPPVCNTVECEPTKKLHGKLRGWKGNRAEVEIANGTIWKDVLVRKEPVPCQRGANITVYEYHVLNSKNQTQLIEKEFFIETMAGYSLFQTVRLYLLFLLTPLLCVLTHCGEGCFVEEEEHVERKKKAKWLKI